MLDDRIVEADFVQRIVFAEQIVVICEINQLVRAVEHITELEGEHAAVPQRALSDIILRDFLRRLLFEHGDFADLLLTDRDDVAVLFAGIGRLNAHQNEVRAADFSALPQRF